MSQQELPLFSHSYEKKQCFHYQINWEIVVNAMKRNPNDSWSIQKILIVFNESSDYLPLTLSKAIAMEINDRNIVQCEVAKFKYSA